MIEFLGHMTVLLGGAALVGYLTVAITARYIKGGLESIAVPVYAGLFSSILWTAGVIIYWHVFP